MNKFAHRRSVSPEEKEVIQKAREMTDINSPNWVEDMLKNMKKIRGN